jgi:hypothetical protein
MPLGCAASFASTARLRCGKRVNGEVLFVSGGNDTSFFPSGGGEAGSVGVGDDCMFATASELPLHVPYRS